MPRALLLLAGLLLGLVPGRAGTEVMRLDTVPAPSLAGNLLGDPAEVSVAVLLPPAYTAGTRRYPTVYFLLGYGRDELRTAPEYAADLARWHAGHPAAEAIVVLVPGGNRLGGAFYVDSPVTGGWASFVTRTLPAHIDRHYRTLPRRESRGLAGHSMGGFGALHLAMRHPELYGVCYAMSPGLFAEDGLAESQMFRQGGTMGALLDLEDRLAPLAPAEARRAYLDLVDHGTDFNLLFTLAYGAAFSPATTRAPYLRYPFRRTGAGADPVRDDAAWAAFTAGFGDLAAEIRRHADALRQYRSLTLDCGLEEDFRWILAGTLHCAELLRRAGIPHSLVLHDGTHESRLHQQFRDSLLPAMAAHLRPEETAP